MPWATAAHTARYDKHTPRFLTDELKLEYSHIYDISHLDISAPASEICVCAQT